MRIVFPFRYRRLTTDIRLVFDFLRYQSSGIRLWLVAGSYGNVYLYIEKHRLYTVLQYSRKKN